MKRISFLCVLLLGSIAACTPVTAKVFLRVEASPLPPADKTGIQDVVLLWPLRDPSVAAKSPPQGDAVFHLFDANTSPPSAVLQIGQAAPAFIAPTLFPAAHFTAPWR